MNELSEEIFESDYEYGFEGEAEYSDMEYSDMEAGDYEGELDMEWGYEGEAKAGYGEGEGPFSEEQEIEMAAELLSLSEEAELDQFLGKLIRRAGKAAGRFIRSPTGKALGGLLRQAARKALPIAGRALGTFVGGPAGGAIGSKLAAAGGRLFGLELEGMSPEDQELQVARRFVRLAGDAATRAAQASAAVAPQQAARTALASAARVHAPGLLRRGGGRVTGRRPGKTGRWMRRGNKIVLFGV
ncbi:MAG TPA: hypothetical protein VGC93_06905 [Thermoanaerobaculia bacterium]|jgi:hypothetical protein